MCCASMLVSSRLLEGGDEREQACGNWVMLTKSDCRVPVAVLADGAITLVQSATAGRPAILKVTGAHSVGAACSTASRCSAIVSASARCDPVSSAGAAGRGSSRTTWTRIGSRAGRGQATLVDSQITTETPPPFTPTQPRARRDWVGCRLTRWRGVQTGPRRALASTPPSSSKSWDDSTSRRRPRWSSRPRAERIAVVTRSRCHHPPSAGRTGLVHGKAVRPLAC
jgi:hypothetical protein